MRANLGLELGTGGVGASRAQGQWHRLPGLGTNRESKVLRTWVSSLTSPEMGEAVLLRLRKGPARRFLVGEPRALTFSALPHPWQKPTRQTPYLHTSLPNSSSPAPPHPYLSTTFPAPPSATGRPAAVIAIQLNYTLFPGPECRTLLGYPNSNNRLEVRYVGRDVGKGMFLSWDELQEV